MSNTYRTPYTGKLEPKAGYSSDTAFLCSDYEVSKVQEALFPEKYIPAGRCMSRAAGGLMELGVSGHKVGHFLFRASDSASGGMRGPDPSSATARWGNYQDGAKPILRFYNCKGDFEFSTTEFDATLNYAINDPLVAPPIGGGVTYATAGKLTNADVKYGTHAIVAIVSETFVAATPSRNIHDSAALHFFTHFDPPIEAIPDGLEEPTWDT